MMGQQLTLVAFYGQKNDHPLWNFIKQLQDKITLSLEEKNFTPYDPEKIHGTIIGLEGRYTGNETVNENYLKKHGELRSMDLKGLIDFILNDDEIFPILVKIGGYKEDEKYSFISNGKHPYLRSFSIQKKIVVAMGWPVMKINNELIYPSSLDKLRRACNTFSVLHKYHNSAQSYDNDLFFVLGNVREGLNHNLLETCETQIRNDLANSSLPPVEISQNDLKIIAYSEDDTTFRKVGVADVYSLEEAANQIDKLINAYPDFDT